MHLCLLLPLPLLCLLQCQLQELKQMACAALGVDGEEFELHDYKGCRQGANVSTACCGCTAVSWQQPVIDRRRCRCGPGSQ